MPNESSLWLHRGAGWHEQSEDDGNEQQGRYIADEVARFCRITDGLHGHDDRMYDA